METHSYLSRKVLKRKLKSRRLDHLLLLYITIQLGKECIQSD